MKNRLITGLLVLLSVSVLTLFNTTSTKADDSLRINHKNEEFLSRNKILFYDPNAGDCEPHTFSEEAYQGSTVDGIKLASLQVGFIEKFHSLAESLSIEFGIPWEAVMAQGILESTSGTSNLATTRNNFFGIGAFDSNPDNAFRYETPEKGWRGYYENIAKTSVYRTKGAFNYPGDPHGYIAAIASTYASAPNYEKETRKLIDELIALAKKKNWKLSSELIISNPEMIKNAEANQKGIKPTNPSGGSAFNNKCLSPQLKTGGMNLEEAQAFMEHYAKEADKMTKISPIKFDGARIDGHKDCATGTLNNCSGFVQWFLNRYTSLGPDKAILKQGSQAATYYINNHNSIIDGGGVPKIYAIMSEGPFEGHTTINGVKYNNHTAIVLGINIEKNQVILGEAGCVSSVEKYYRPKAKVVNLNHYLNINSPYGPKYAYLDNILKIGN